MAAVSILPAAPLHARYIARRMRQADRDEVAASSGSQPFEAIARCMRLSDRSWTGCADGVPVIIFGVGYVSVVSDVAAPWLLGTDDVEKYAIPFLRGSRECLRQLLTRYSVLRNYVDSRNVVAVRWLEWLGFQFGETIQQRGVDFRFFEKVRANV